MPGSGLGLGGVDVDVGDSRAAAGEKKRAEGDEMRERAEQTGAQLTPSLGSWLQHGEYRGQTSGNGKARWLGDTR